MKTPFHPNALLCSALLFNGLLAAVGQTLQPQVLYNFQRGPANPRASLVQGPDGNFYGTTQDGGSGGSGTVFKVTNNGVLTTLVSFTGSNGANPSAALALGRDGALYGTTETTVFKVTTDGVLTTLVWFNGTNGAIALGGLVLGSDGCFYGTTSTGGIGYGAYGGGNGTVFKVTTNGVLTTLASFNGTNGMSPLAGLTLGRDGNFYGTTFYGGTGYVYRFVDVHNGYQ